MPIMAIIVQRRLARCKLLFAWLLWTHLKSFELHDSNCSMALLSYAGLGLLMPQCSCCPFITALCGKTDLGQLASKTVKAGSPCSKCRPSGAWGMAPLVIDGSRIAVLNSVFPKPGDWSRLWPFAEAQFSRFVVLVACV
ncbi:unnamed protein product [Ostreobium quekettii]|uniref:Secreted protein n=1 Tax=Ostreobium quekettii TaxID=121088 RepID=A0A8S1ISI5_9CHLO|nr:unnamed protein product [Ostreobium quekettii]